MQPKLRAIRDDEVGRVFDQFGAMKRNRAEEMMREQPTTTVARVAESVGSEERKPSASTRGHAILK